MGDSKPLRRWTAAGLGLLCAALIMITPIGLSAEMYRWTDEDGNLHFSDTPPLSGDVKTLDFDEPTCALKAKLERTRGGIPRPLLLEMLGVRVDKGEDIPPEYQDFLNDYKAEDNKCRDGDKEACSCIASLARDGATSIAPTGGTVRESR